MPRLPSLNARQVIRALKRAGFVADRQKGSHVILLHPVTKTRTVVPFHAGRAIRPSLLQAIVKESGLSTNEFLNLL